MEILYCCVKFIQNKKLMLRLRYGRYLALLVCCSIIMSGDLKKMNKSSIKNQLQPPKVVVHVEHKAKNLGSKKEEERNGKIFP